MNKEFAIKYGLYCKGEEEIPEREKFECTDKEFKVFDFFWRMEAEYSNIAFPYENLRKMWEECGNDGASGKSFHPDFLKFISNPKWSRIQRGFLFYAAAMPPMFVDTVLEYGKCTDLKLKPEPKPKTAWEGMMEICRYYRGGNVNPYPWGTAKAHFWELEWEFANDYFQKQPTLEEEYDSGFGAAFPDQLSKAPYGAIFRPLKAFLHARYYNSGGSDAGFPGYLDYYLENQ